MIYAFTSGLSTYEFSNIEEPTGAGEGKQEKRRSFLQQPKSYVSKLPTLGASHTPSPPTVPSIPKPIQHVSSKPLEVYTPKTKPIPIPQSCPTGQDSLTDTPEPQEFFIGDRITIGGIKTGTLLYFGTTHIAAGLWCGISLDEPEGIHDGFVNNVRYFTCRKGHGIFAPVERVSHLDAKAVRNIIKTPPRFSQIPSKSNVCDISPIKDEIDYDDRSEELISDILEPDISPITDEIGYDDRSEELLDDILEPELEDDILEPELEEDILGLDEHGILHDDYLDQTFDSNITKESSSVKPKRKLPTPPGHSEQTGTRLKYLEKDGSKEESIEYEDGERQDSVDTESDLEEFESLRTFSMEEKFCEGSEIQSSAGGSSAGEDSWSLHKDYLAMCDGKAQYLNITFDGESESKASTQEPSEESPSPEFIFDQEMIEDGEFCSQPVEVSRDSSLGLISSFTLDKNDLLTEIFGEDEEEELMTSQGTLEPMSEDKDTSPEKTPERQSDLNSSVDLDDGDIVTSTPYVDNSTKAGVVRNLNETYTQDDSLVESSHKPEKVCLNSTFTQETGKSVSSQGNVGNTENLNGTFTVDDKDDQSIEKAEKADIPSKGAMVDSGISLRGSMSESSGSLRASMMESAPSMKGSLMDPGIRRSMLDSGISVQSAIMSESQNALKAASSATKSDLIEKVKDANSAHISATKVCFVESSVLGEEEGMSKGVVHTELDDRKLMQDLTDGHVKKDRPISFLSTTSADTGYLPDTDSEFGTLTLNSPQEWMDRGFHGPSVKPVPELVEQEIEDAKTGRLVPVGVESDSDIGTMTCDTDTDGDVGRAEVIAMGNISEDNGESEDEITQIEDKKGLNTTVTLESKKQNDTITIEPSEDSALESTFTIEGEGKQETGEKDKDENENNSAVNETIDIVEIVIEDNDKSLEIEKCEIEERISEKKVEKQKVQKKKRFNVVKDFKKPNTTNVVSKLSEYLKTPVPIKKREDKHNTEEAKNKRNSIKGKIDLSKVTSKIGNKSIVDESKKKNEESEKKDSPEQVEKEKEVKEVKKIKRTPPKSKWDAIMNKIETKKDTDKEKPKPEVKSKLEAFLHIPPPAPPKKEVEPPKPKKRISSAMPDYSKVQSKLKYTAPPPPPKPRKDESPSRSTTNSPRGKMLSPGKAVPDSPKRKPSLVKSASPNRARNGSPGRKDSKDQSPSRSKEEINNGKEKLASKRLSIQNERVRNLSGDSLKRPEIRDKVVHIDLAESLDGRGSRMGMESAMSSRQSSQTDMSTTEDDNLFNDGTVKMLPQIERAMSLQDRRDSSNSISEISEAGSQVTAHELELKMQKAAANQLRRKSGLVQPNNYQNRNKTSKSKTKDEKGNEKVVETVPAEVHTQEVQRLEALCEGRTKQLNMVKLQLQSTTLAFDGMASTVNYLAHDLDAFSCPSLVKSIENSKKLIEEQKMRITGHEENKASLEGIIANMKEQHKEYITSLESETDKTLQYQREALEEHYQDELKEVKTNKSHEISELRKSHEAYIMRLEREHEVAMDTLRATHGDAIRQLQSRQEHQMEELHKQHQDKLEDITSRFDGIKVTLSEKVDTLRSECERLRERARHCEDALQRDSDFKVQCALAPYKNLPKEIESLKTVLEMRNAEISKLKTHNTELAKKLEELPVAQEKIISLHQKKENLEAIISMKTDHEKTLHERCQSLMRKYDKESRANKRLSMEYEELMWKLSESFSESDVGTQEAAFYQKLGMSPTSELGSPVFGRKLRTPNGSEGSPSKSPGYRRTLSSSVDDREEKKLKRRSGNYLIDEAKQNQRATSPLAKQNQNPLTKSWSPGTQSSSPSPTRMTGKTVGKMSQSWCVEMDNSHEGVEPASRIPRSKSSSEKQSRRKLITADIDSGENVDNDKMFVSTTESLNTDSHCIEESVELSASLKSNGLSEKSEDSFQISSTPRSGRETVTLSTSYNVFNENDQDNQSMAKQDSGELRDSLTQPANQSTSGASLRSETVLCPVSKLPIKSDKSDSDDHSASKGKSHTETTV
ncbi:CAP-Gly domain-containing linker protein 1-like isoform X2 [Mya arenaria]|uniref:CAP-Gly domain-containing linker protein 1-like isoform X2 n=1 Tax=Mya arenaria TaxID=6604 RepID=UPI0022E43785|nr:CAP-Gly domain-containing linker protein 1-like isoform X2 [Mya arenaria]